MLLRPVGRLLAMQFLHFASQVRELGYVEELAPDMPLGHDERQLAAELLSARTTHRLDFGQYCESLQRQSASSDRSQGRRPADRGAAGGRTAAVINLMDALRQSLAEATREADKPPKRTTAGRKPARQRKSSQGGRAKSF